MTLPQLIQEIKQELEPWGDMPQGTIISTRRSTLRRMLGKLQQLTLPSQEDIDAITLMKTTTLNIWHDPISGWMCEEDNGKASRLNASERLKALRKSRQKTSD